MTNPMTSPNPDAGAWKLVPVEPTNEMLDAARALMPVNISSRDETREMFQAMLTAAPAPASVDAVAVREAWSFLQDRLLEFEQEIGSGDEEREWAGHVHPALSRFNTLLASLSPDETSGVEAGGEAKRKMADMAMLIRLLVRNMEPGLKIREAAVDYLKRHDLMGSPLREAEALVKPSSPAGGDVREIKAQIVTAFNLSKDGRVRTLLNDAAHKLAALSPSTSAAEPVAFPAYGEMPFDELGQAVMAARYGKLSPFEFDAEFYPGHQMTGAMNFNSLNRIVTWFVKRATPPTPAAVESAQGVKEARERARNLLFVAGVRYDDPQFGAKLDAVAAALEDRASLATDKEG